MSNIVEHPQNKLVPRNTVCKLWQLNKSVKVREILQKNYLCQRHFSLMSCQLGSCLRNVFLNGNLDDFLLAYDLATNALLIVVKINEKCLKVILPFCHKLIKKELSCFFSGH